MKILRTTLAIVIVLLFVGGYAASQMASLNGWASQYALKVDSPTVSRLALFLLVAVVVLGFIKEPGAEDS